MFDRRELLKALSAAAGLAMLPKAGVLPRPVGGDVPLVDDLDIGKAGTMRLLTADGTVLAETTWTAKRLPGMPPAWDFDIPDTVVVATGVVSVLEIAGPASVERVPVNVAGGLNMSTDCLVANGELRLNITMRQGG